MGTWIMAGITFREAARKKILWTALHRRHSAFWSSLASGCITRWRISARPHPAFLRYQILSGMLMIGLYTVDLLAVVMTILTSVDTISGEIASGTIHAIATKPMARWQILIGKWMGFVGMLAIYVAHHVRRNARGGLLDRGASCRKIRCTARCWCFWNACSR